MVKDTLLSHGYLPKFPDWINLLIKSFEIKTKDLTWSGFASMSMTADAAIRIDLTLCRGCTTLPTRHASKATPS